MELPADSVNEDSADSTAGAASPSAAASDSPPPGAGRCVCPFCGKIHSRSEPACPQCKMENTAANRAAARTRAGPWHLLIAATPNAAGIKWDALLEMVAKGQITLRTVVRGPSTNQLWRFAGRTRGLSREFGICYGCGRAISRTTEICPECQRWQLPPADPDALLEDHEEQGKPVYRQVGQPTGAAAAPAPPQATSAPSRTSQGATLPETSHGPASPVAPAAHGALPKALLTPKELAAAFSLEFPPPQPKYRRMGLRRAVTIALPLAAIVAVILACTVPPLRDPISQWYAKIRPSQTDAATPQQIGDPNDDPFVEPAPRHDSLIDELPPVPRARPVASTAFLMGDNPPRQDAKVEEPSPLPAPAPAVNSQPSADASAQDGKPDSPADSQQEIELAMGLFANAIDAESRHDYSSAIWYYQKIEERIPKEDWPGGLEIRLEAAEKQLGQK